MSFECFVYLNQLVIERISRSIKDHPVNGHALCHGCKKRPKPVFAFSQRILRKLSLRDIPGNPNNPADLACCRPQGHFACGRPGNTPVRPDLLLPFSDDRNARGHDLALVAQGVLRQRATTKIKGRFPNRLCWIKQPNPFRQRIIDPQITAFTILEKNHVGARRHEAVQQLPVPQNTGIRCGSSVRLRPFRWGLVFVHRKRGCWKNKITRKDRAVNSAQQAVQRIFPSPPSRGPEGPSRPPNAPRPDAGERSTARPAHYH